MKRRILAMLLILLALGPLTALADETPTSAAAAYYLDGTLYTFAKFPGYEDAADLQVGLMVQGVQIGEEQTARRLTEGEAPARYLMLVDCSTSMPEYADRVEALAEALLSSSENAALSIATFGVEFRVQAEDLTAPDQVQGVLRGLEYGEQGTDICGGAARGVEYLKKNRWEPGELLNVVLITDGEPFYSHDPDTEAQSEETAAETLRTMLSDSPQVLLHSVSFGPWEPVTYRGVTSGIGNHLTAEDVSAAEEAGRTISGFYQSLYGLRFPLETFQEDLSLRISNTEFITIGLLHDLTEPEEESLLDNLPLVIDTEQTPEEPEAPAPPSPLPEETPAPTDAPPETPAPTEPPGPSEIPEDPDVISAVPEPESEDSNENAGSIQEPLSQGSPTGIEESSVSQQDGPAGLSSLVLALLVGVAVLLVVLAAILIGLLLVRRKKRPTENRRWRPSGGTSGFPIRMEVLCGNVTGGSRRLYLSDSLLFGADQRCDVVFFDPKVSPVNTRVYHRDGILYIEDLNSSHGTAVGGMRIYAPNLLRSGDQITIGDSCIALYF